jgi:hypothetical protein
MIGKLKMEGCYSMQLDDTFAITFPQSRGRVLLSFQRKRILGAQNIEATSWN